MLYWQIIAWGRHSEENEVARFLLYAHARAERAIFGLLSSGQVFFRITIRRLFKKKIFEMNMV